MENIDAGALCTIYLPVTESSSLHYFITFLNIGTGVDQSIQELALNIKKIVGFESKIRFDRTNADGTYKKLLDISRLRAFGFKPRYTLVGGIKMVYQHYISEEFLISNS